MPQLGGAVVDPFSRLQARAAMGGRPARLRPRDRARSRRLRGTTWNAGIAATALGRWERARAAWASVGITMPPGDGPVEMRIGPTPVRVSPAENPEVVWCDRIDPCRAIIQSVPLPESDRRYGDLLLHDGEARGRRQSGNQSVPVFDELDVLERSAYGTWEIVVRCCGSGAAAFLDRRSGARRAERRGLDRQPSDAVRGLQPWRAPRPPGAGPNPGRMATATPPGCGGALGRRSVAAAPRVLLVALRSGVRASGAVTSVRCEVRAAATLDMARADDRKCKVAGTDTAGDIVRG